MKNVKMKPSQYRHLVESYGEETAKEVIDAFSCKLADGSTDSANHFATIVSWLGYRRRMGSGSVPLSSKAADPSNRDSELVNQTLMQAWDKATEQERQQYLLEHGCYPWEEKRPWQH